MADNLHSLLLRWQEWAAGASRSDDGWETFFPHWQHLIKAAQICMVSFDGTEDRMSDLELAWSISEESEELVDFAKENLSSVWPVISGLVKSKYPRVRWQMYEVAGAAGSRGHNLLWQGLDDSDAYCRRRALLAFGRPDRAMRERLIQKLARDEDPTIRRICSEL